jgi:tetratricopeptide (TPR) repeat protein
MKQRMPQQFAATVADSLKHYNNPLWLGQYSPLATPYFLGPLLQAESQAETALGRGHGLQQAIAQAADSLWPGEPPQSQRSLRKLVEKERAEELNGPRYLYLLLDLRYLRRYFLPSSAPNTVGAMYDMLNVSETRFFAHLQIARSKLAEALLRITRPSLRLEQPLAPPLIGRDQVRQQCADDLGAGRSLTISGLAGIGKTSLGAAVAQQWPSGAVFWHTFRPGLNDDLSGVVFALAHFLHRYGCSSLWLQLVAGEGVLGSMEQIAGFLRDDLACAAELPALLCFDEVDLLHTESTQPRHGVHKQVLELLESLRTVAPLLLIGQRPLIDTDTYTELEPLTLADTELFLQRAALPEPVNARQVFRQTEGNPRFMELYVALHKSAGPDEALDLGRSPSLKPLFHRLWKRLDKDEKRVLTTLSIFRSIAPIDAWQGQVGLEKLQHRNLLKGDARGGVALLSIFRDLVYGELPPEQRRQLHSEGALIRAQRGQYTEAAHHLWQAEQFETAVNLWYDNATIEIEQGKAGAAYGLFSGPRPSGLPEPAARRLKVIQDRLSLLHGDASAVLENIDSYSWHLDEQITAEALEQWGRAHHILGDVDQAISDFDQAISVLGELSTKIVFLHRRRVQAYIELADLDLAEQETRLAEVELFWFKGLIEFTQGHFLRARDHLNTARKIAEAAADAKRIAEVDQLLAMAAGNHGDYERAREHAEEAMAYFERTGDRLNLEHMRAELAGFYLNERRFAEAIEPLESALRFFENIKHDLRISHISSNLAEAYFETGQLERAEQFAARAIQSENPKVQPYAFYTLAQVRYAQDRVADAEHVFRSGIDLAARSRDNFILAYLYRAYGQIMCREQRAAEGRQNLTKARDLFSQLEMAPEVEETNRLLVGCAG